MLKRTLVLLGSAAAIVTLLTVSPAKAVPPLETVNYLTFKGAVALPGTVLIPGSYAFEAGPGGVSRQVVRVTTRDGRRTLFMGFTIPVSRPAGSNAPAVTFGEAAAGAPMPIQAWYPVGSSVGHRFVY